MPARIFVVSLALMAAACVAAGCSGRAHAVRADVASASAASPADAGRGREVYQAQCAACHGARGVGGPVGPALRNENARRPYRSVYHIVLYPAPPMPKLYPGRMTLSDVRDVSAYVESL